MRLFTSAAILGLLATTALAGPTVTFPEPVLQ
jgi:hypothetical protein